MSDKPKIVFLLASISQPRCLKRIRSFIDAGFEIEIYGFDRGIYNNNATIQGYTINNMGFAQSGSGYLKKFFFARNKLKDIFKNNDEPNVLFYSFSFDMALICKLYNKEYIYEISDLVYGYFKSKLVRIIFKKIDRVLISKSFLTVMTSQGFYDYILPSSYSLQNVIIQPNRIDSYFSNLKRNTIPIDAENIAFSYVGAFRYPNTVFRFAKVIGEKYPQHSFLFFGDSHLTDQVQELAKTYNNVKYYGQFKNPEDLTRIYSKINVVIACYDIKTLNERIAEPNKLYESLFFNKPIIVSKGTFLESQVVEKYKCGYAIDASVDDNICKLIDSLDNSSLEHLVSTIKTVATNDIVDDKSSAIIKFIKKKK